MQRSRVFIDMTKSFWCVLLPVLAASFAVAQAHPATTTVCQVTAHPNTFDGQIITIRARVVSGFEVFAIEDPSGKCDRMWLEYAEANPIFKGSSQPGGRPPLELRRDPEFEKFQSFLSAEMHPRSRNVICSGGCGARYEVNASMTGRIDVAPRNHGFGHLGGYRFRFRLQSVSDVSATDLSSKYDAALFSATSVEFPTGHLTGVVRAPSGETLKGIEVTARLATDFPSSLGRVTKWTDENGRFTFDVPPGTYFVGVNIDVATTTKYPYLPTFFPGTTDRSAAKAITVADGDRVDASIGLLRPAARQDIAVRIHWPDGKPAENATVFLKELRTPYGAAASWGHTDPDGLIVLPGFENVGYKVEVYKNVLLPKGYEHYCAPPEAIGSGREIVMHLTVKGEDECQRLIH